MPKADYYALKFDRRLVVLMEGAICVRVRELYLVEENSKNITRELTSRDQLTH